MGSLEPMSYSDTRWSTAARAVPYHSALDALLTVDSPRTRQEPLASSWQCKALSWQGLGQSGAGRAQPAASQPTSSKTANQSSSQGSSSAPTSESQPASSLTRMKPAKAVGNQLNYSAKRVK